MSLVAFHRKVFWDLCYSYFLSMILLIVVMMLSQSSCLPTMQNYIQSSLMSLQQLAFNLFWIMYLVGPTAGS